MSRVLLPLAALALGVFAVLALIDRKASDDRAAERRALYDRDAALARAVLAPGSALACLTGTAGEAVENACEKNIFASPERTAAAVTYMGAQLQLLKDAAAFAARGDAGALADFAAARRAVELDRFGLAAQVLSVRDGCTAKQCAAFALIGDANALKSNLKAQVFDQYVARYAAGWSAPAQADRPPAAAVSEAPAPPALAAAARAEPVARPLSGKYDFPSAASIPPVSIMNTEPPRPKDDPAAPAAAVDKLPPKRPQAEAAQAAPPPPR